MNKAWKRLMMVAVCAALGTVWAGAARASFDFFAPTVTSDGTGGFDYSYFLVFNNGGTTMPPLPSQYQLHTNDFATLYDVASENSITVYNSASAPATDMAVSSSLTGATPVGVSGQPTASAASTPLSCKTSG